MARSQGPAVEGYFFHCSSLSEEIEEGPKLLFSDMDRSGWCFVWVQLHLMDQFVLIAHAFDVNCLVFSITVFSLFSLQTVIYIKLLALFVY